MALEKMAPKKMHPKNGTMQIWKQMAPYLIFQYSCLKSTFESTIYLCNIATRIFIYSITQPLDYIRD